MKKHILTIIIIFSSLLIYSQDKSTLNTRYTLRDQYLFNTFQKGEVHFKNGLVSKAMLNYNVCTEQIYFTKNDQLFDIANKDDIKYVLINDIKFYYFKETYLLELLKKNDYVLLKKITVSDDNLKRVGPYGTNTETTGTEKLKTVEGRALKSSYQIDLDEGQDEELRTIVDYFILYDNKLYNLNKKSIHRIFKDKKEEIENFKKKNKIRLNDEKDILLLFNSVL